MHGQQQASSGIPGFSVTAEVFMHVPLPCSCQDMICHAIHSTCMVMNGWGYNLVVLAGGWCSIRVAWGPTALYPGQP